MNKDERKKMNRTTMSVAAKIKELINDPVARRQSEMRIFLMTRQMQQKSKSNPSPLQRAKHAFRRYR
jgi:hypothetical protein